MSRWGLRQVSAKREAEIGERRRIVRQAHERDRGCRARGLAPGRCSGPLDGHERVPRSAWRAGYLVLENVLIVCRAHHDWIGDHPDEAHALGLHGYSYERPDA